MRVCDLTVSEYLLADERGPRLQRMAQTDGSVLWRIGDPAGHYVLARDGKWEYDPLPSNRDAEYLSRCRYRSPTEALSHWLTYLAAPAADPPGRCER